ncbi:Putative peptidoglycan binding domain-containing protein [Tistlia consotensis]|uniref:Putative peptidoglycan binding domain-containing protein n=2 Tax=Tistlia TaxID=1321364 RepID=A0A1Y6BU41_9PROT|nr:Putative peptidoglycan binding domain-containing protein [Tistlia consotensis USBA 355]SNR46907.1 Putative peptidoglycan binding domain-containing protein [Tistlia consotensis]
MRCDGIGSSDGRNGGADGPRLDWGAEWTSSLEGRRRPGGRQDGGARPDGVSDAEGFEGFEALAASAGRAVPEGRSANRQKQGSDAPAGSGAAARQRRPGGVRAEGRDRGRSSRPRRLPEALSGPALAAAVLLAAAGLGAALLSQFSGGAEPPPAAVASAGASPHGNAAATPVRRDPAERSPAPSEPAAPPPQAADAVPAPETPAVAGEPVVRAVPPGEIAGPAAPPPSIRSGGPTSAAAQADPRPTRTVTARAAAKLDNAADRAPLHAAAPDAQASPLAGRTMAHGPAPAPRPSRTARAPAAQAPSDLVAKVQRGLLQNGINPGPVNGVADALTRAAVVAFQRRVGAVPDGIIDGTLLSRLEAARPSSTQLSQLVIRTTTTHWASGDAPGDRHRPAASGRPAVPSR